MSEHTAPSLEQFSDPATGQPLFRQKRELTSQERVKAGEQAIKGMFDKLRELRLEAYVYYPNHGAVWITKPGREISVVTNKEPVNERAVASRGGVFRAPQPLLW